MLALNKASPKPTKTSRSPAKSTHMTPRLSTTTPRVTTITSHPKPSQFTISSIPPYSISLPNSHVPYVSHPLGRSFASHARGWREAGRQPPQRQRTTPPHLYKSSCTSHSDEVSWLHLSTAKVTRAILLPQPKSFYLFSKLADLNLQGSSTLLGR